MKLLSYRVLLRKEPDCGYTVIVPSLPGCVTYGDTIEEAIEMVKEAIELYIESLKTHGEEISTEEVTFEYTLTVQTHANLPSLIPEKIIKALERERLAT